MMNERPDGGDNGFRTCASNKVQNVKCGKPRASVPARPLNTLLAALRPSYGDETQPQLDMELAVVLGFTLVHCASRVLEKPDGAAALLRTLWRETVHPTLSRYGQLVATFVTCFRERPSDSRTTFARLVRLWKYFVTFYKQLLTDFVHKHGTTPQVRLLEGDFAIGAPLSAPELEGAVNALVTHCVLALGDCDKLKIQSGMLIGGQRVSWRAVTASTSFFAVPAKLDPVNAGHWLRLGTLAYEITDDRYFWPWCWLLRGACTLTRADSSTPQETNLRAIASKFMRKSQSGVPVGPVGFPLHESEALRLWFTHILEIYRATYKPELSSADRPTSAAPAADRSTIAALLNTLDPESLHMVSLVNLGVTWLCDLRSQHRSHGNPRANAALELVLGFFASLLDTHGLAAQAATDSLHKHDLRKLLEPAHPPHVRFTILRVYVNWFSKYFACTDIAVAWHTCDMYKQILTKLCALLNELRAQHGMHFDVNTSVAVLDPQHQCLGFAPLDGGLTDVPSGGLPEHCNRAVQCLLMSAIEITRLSNAPLKFDTEFRVQEPYLDCEDEVVFKKR